MLILYIFIGVFGLVLAKNEDYKGYKVYAVEVDTEYKEEHWTELKSDLIDFWKAPSYKYGVNGLAMVPPSHFKLFDEKLTELGIPIDIFVEDVYEYLAAKESKLSIDSRDDAEIFQVRSYQRYDNILSYLRTLQETYTNTNLQVELVEDGFTHQNRPLVYLKLSNTETNNPNVPKSVIVVEAGINPREWITVPAALNVIEELLSNPRYLDEIEWVIIPVVNPDGYEYTHTNAPSYKYGVNGLAMVPPSHFKLFDEKLTELGIPIDIFVEDVYEYLAAKESKLSIDSRDDAEIFQVRSYQRYDNILSYLRTLQETYTNTNLQVELVEDGFTHQNRPLVYLKLSNTETNNPNVPKSVIVVEAGINPREWITVPAALNVIEELLSNPRYLDEIEWVIIPVVNPDGYEYTHTNMRLWTKSMSLQSHMGAICPGVHINRNFDLDFGNFDASSSPCSHVFSGVAPSSEPETNMIENIIDIYGTRIKLYLSLQNNGGFISYPWSYERAASGLFRQHHLLGIEMIRAVSDGYYNIDVASTIFDRASGTSIDYARDKNILYTYNMDIVQSDDGVLIPEDRISDIVDDVWRAIAVAAEFVPTINL